MKRLAQLFGNAAGFECGLSSFVPRVLIAGDKVWRYTNFKLDRNFPKRLANIPADVDAALYFNKNKKLLFFKVSATGNICSEACVCFLLPPDVHLLFQGSAYWQWDEIGPTDFSSYPKPANRLFRGLPRSTDAAFTWTNGNVYFFKGSEYWRVNVRWQAVEKSYPKSTAARWMHCKN